MRVPKVMSERVPCIYIYIYTIWELWSALARVWRGVGVRRAYMLDLGRFRSSFLEIWSVVTPGGLLEAPGVLFGGVWEVLGKQNLYSIFVNSR